MEDRTDTVQSHQGKATTLVKRMAWVDAVMADSDLDASAKCLAYALARHQNDDSLQCNPSSRRLAGELGRHERSVRGSADALERSGWITTRGPKGRSLQFDLISPEAREPRVSTPALTPGVDTRAHPGRPRPTPPDVHARTPRASTPAEPVTNQSGTQQLQPAKALNQPQAATVETENERPPASVGDDVASIGGNDEGFRHDALSGGCEPPAGAVPDLAEGDLGEAVVGGVDDPFPSEWPDDAEKRDGGAFSVQAEAAPRCASFSGGGVQLDASQVLELKGSHPSLDLAFVVSKWRGYISTRMTAFHWTEFQAVRSACAQEYQT